MRKQQTLTHEQFIDAVAQIAARRADLTPEEKGQFNRTKLAYGHGPGGCLGITYHRKWAPVAAGPTGPQVEPAPFVELCAGLERSFAELTGTVLHELGHAILGPGHGHGKDWKMVCKRLGLRLPKAVAGHKVQGWASIAPDVRFAVLALGAPTDGQCAVPDLTGPRGGAVRPCGTGIGTRGGKSRGPGSGSRSIKTQCGDCGYVARVTRKWLDSAGAPLCPSGHGALVEPAAN